MESPTSAHLASFQAYLFIHAPKLISKARDKSQTRPNQPFGKSSWQGKDKRTFRRKSGGDLRAVGSDKLVNSLAPSAKNDLALTRSIPSSAPSTPPPQRRISPQGHGLGSKTAPPGEPMGRKGGDTCKRRCVLGLAECQVAGCL